MSRYHFLRSSDGEACASMLIEYSVMCGYPSEFDMFIAQAVLQYVSVLFDILLSQSVEINCCSFKCCHKNDCFSIWEKESDNNDNNNKICRSKLNNVVQRY